MRILIVEPDRILAQNYRLALESAGHEVEWRSDGQSAVHCLDEERPDLVVLELQMPVHNGLEFLYELRSYPEWQDIPVIVASVVPEKDVDGGGGQLKLLGVSQYLHKPTTKLSHLVAAVNRLLHAAEV